MIFEWDENKNRINLKKHGLSFEEAVQIFKDPNICIVPDLCETEERWDAVGLANKVLFVVYVEREKDTVRIISARKASKEEINDYENHVFGRR